jgi:glycosyltransferase involved in cell wall biosynthesis
VLGTELGVSGVGFRDGEHGRLAEEPDGLAAAAIALLDDPAATARLGERGRRLAEAFRWPAVMEPAEAAFRRLASPAA